MKISKFIIALILGVTLISPSIINPVFAEDEVVYVADETQISLDY